MSNDLNIPQLEEAQSRPDVTANDATAALGDAIANTLTADCTSGNVTVTAAQYRTCQRIRITNATTTRSVTLPASILREFMLVEMVASSTHTVSLIKGSTTLTLQANRTYLIRTESDANTLAAFDVGGTDQPSDFHIFVPGTMINSQLLYFMKVTRPFTLPVSLAGSYLLAQVAATADTTFTFKKSGSSIGSALVTAAGTTGAFTFVSAVAFAVGDSFSIHGQASADATIATISVDLKASR